MLLYSTSSYLAIEVKTDLQHDHPAGLVMYQSAIKPACPHLEGGILEIAVTYEIPAALDLIKGMGFEIQTEIHTCAILIAEIAASATIHKEIHVIAKN